MAATALAGCTSTEETKETTTTTAAPTVTAPPLPKEPTFAGTPAGAVMDVKVVDCPTDPGERTAKLELTNSSKKPRDYAIMVIWLKNGSGTPLGSTLVQHKAAAPGKKTTLSAKAKVVEKADKCVLNVKAGTLK
ncbi:hypothetical protein GCM10009599_06690 [Luteococcus peritonei]